MPAYQYIYVMKGLGKTYPGGREVLKDIFLSFLPGAKIGVLGANGAGKSTLLRIMAGEERDFAGEAWSAICRRSRRSTRQGTCSVMSARASPRRRR
jgi:sulfate-transporting ATPase